MTSTRTLAIWTTTVFLTLTALTASAQDPPHGSLGLRIEGLTLEERDAVLDGLRRSREGDLVFACVPAGVLIIGSPVQGRSITDWRQSVRSTVGSVVAAERILEDGIDQEEAEFRCSNARNQ